MPRHINRARTYINTHTHTHTQSEAELNAEIWRRALPGGLVLRGTSHDEPTEDSDGTSDPQAAEKKARLTSLLMATKNMLKFVPKAVNAEAEQEGGI